MFYISRIDGTKENYYRVEAPKSTKDKESEEKEEKKKEDLKKDKTNIRASFVANEVMSRSHFVRGEQSLRHAWDILSEANFQSLPVLSEEGKLVGMLSGKDLLREMGKKGETSQVSEVMKTNILCASDDTDVTEIATLFFDERVHLLPIVDRQSRMIGVVTQGDLLKTMMKVGKLHKSD